MNDQEPETSLLTDDIKFVERQISRTSAKDDKALALVSLTMWASECLKRGASILGGTWKTTLKGKGANRHSTCAGSTEDGQRVGVRVRVCDDD